MISSLEIVKSLALPAFESLELELELELELLELELELLELELESLLEAELPEPESFELVLPELELLAVFCEPPLELPCEPPQALRGMQASASASASPTATILARTSFFMVTSLLNARSLSCRQGHSPRLRLVQMSMTRTLMEARPSPATKKIVSSLRER